MQRLGRYLQRAPSLKPSSRASHKINCVYPADPQALTPLRAALPLQAQMDRRPTPDPTTRLQPARVSKSPSSVFRSWSRTSRILAKRSKRKAAPPQGSSSMARKALVKLLQTQSESRMRQKRLRSLAMGWRRAAEKQAAQRNMPT
jgi:hypothetical protein